MNQVNPFEAISEQLAEINQKVSDIDTRLSGSHVTDTKDEYLTTDQAARMLKVSRVTLWSWRKKGILEPVSLSGMLRYKLSDIEAMAK